MNIEEIKVDDEWEWYLGQLYFKLIENMPKPKVAVELAPGFRYKIALALSELGFDGTLFVIDANKDVAEYIKFKYKQILPNAKIECICKTFEKAIDVLPQNIDIFLANHVIDDLMLESYVNKSYYNQLLSNNKDRERYLSVWNNFSQDKKSIQEITNELNKTFVKLFNEKNVGKVILSQYKSNLFYQGQDECIEKIVRKTFDNLKAFFYFDDWAKEALTFHPFGEDERYLGKELLENTQNIDNWIVGSPKKRWLWKKE